MPHEAIAQLLRQSRDMTSVYSECLEAIRSICLEPINSQGNASIELLSILIIIHKANGEISRILEDIDQRDEAC